MEGRREGGKEGRREGGKEGGRYWHNQKQTPAHTDIQVLVSLQFLERLSEKAHYKTAQHSYHSISWGWVPLEHLGCLDNTTSDTIL